MKRNFEPDFLGQTQEERDKIAFEMQKSPFKSWIQMNDNQVNNLIYLTDKSPLAMKILLFLAKHSDNYNAVMVSQSTLGEIFSVSRVSINNAIKVLKEHNFLQLQRSGNGFIYFLNSNVVWKSYGTNHKFAEFNAKIIFSKEEMKGLEINKISIQKGTRVEQNIEVQQAK